MNWWYAFFCWNSSSFTHDSSLVYYIYSSSLCFLLDLFVPPLWSLWSSNDAQSIIVTKHSNMCTLCFYLVRVCNQKQGNTHIFYKQLYCLLHFMTSLGFDSLNLCSSKRTFEQFAMETKEIKFRLWILLTCKNLITTICSHDTICHTTICCPNFYSKCTLISWNMVKNLYSHYGWFELLTLTSIMQCSNSSSSMQFSGISQPFSSFLSPYLTRSYL